MNSSPRYINIPHRHGQCHITVWGQGSKKIAAFHGYGHNGFSFQKFANVLDKDFTLFAFDLPFHGQSTFAENTELSKEELNDLFESFLKKEQIDKIRLMGYSLGGRVALCLLEKFGPSIEKVLLMASDGLIRNSYYAFVTRNGLGRFLFKKVVHSPCTFLKLTNLITRLKFITPSRKKFVQKYLSHPKEALFLYKVWPALKQVLPDYEQLQKVVYAHQIPIQVVVGKWDNIIPVTNAKRFKKHIPQSEIIVVEKGHQLLHPDIFPLYIKFLKA